MIFVTTITHSRMVRTDLAIEEVALDLRSRAWQVLRDMPLSVIFSAVLSGWQLAFTISVDDVVLTSFTTGPRSTILQLLIWFKVKLGVPRDIDALATITVVVIGVGLALAGYVMIRAERQRDRDMQMAYRGSQ